MADIVAKVPNRWELIFLLLKKSTDDLLSPARGPSFMSKRPPARILPGALRTRREPERPF